MDIEEVKFKIQELVRDINSLSPLKNVQFAQQQVDKTHMSIIGAEGRLCLDLNKTTYDIGLSGETLEEKMYKYMQELCRGKCTGHKITKPSKGKTYLPYWRVEDFEIVRKAAHYYAQVNAPSESEIVLPEEILDPDKYIEGSTRVVSVNAYERNSKARKKCIAHFGCQCVVCKFDFEKVYGTIGKGFIHVHHLVPLSEIKQKYRLNPLKDLVPICPNCHAMIHRNKKTLTIEQLKKLLE